MHLPLPRSLRLAADVAHASDAHAPYATRAGAYRIASPWSAGALETFDPGVIFGDIDPANLPVGKAQALAVPAFAKAYQLVTSQIGRLPLKAYRGDVELSQDDTPTWCYATDRELHPSQRMALTIGDLICYGWALWWVERSTAEGRPILTATYVEATDWEFDADGYVLVNGQPVAADQVVLFRGPNEGLLSIAASTIRGALDLELAWSRAARNPIPALIFQPREDITLSETERQQVLDDWRTARRDPDGTVAYVPYGLTWQTAGQLVPDVLVEARNAVSIDVARYFGLPAVALDAGPVQTSLTYQNVSAVSGLQLPLYGLQPYTDAIANRLSLDDVCPRGQRIALDTTTMLAPVATGAPAETRD